MASVKNKSKVAAVADAIKAHAEATASKVGKVRGGTFTPFAGDERMDGRHAPGAWLSSFETASGPAGRARSIAALPVGLSAAWRSTLARALDVATDKRDEGAAVVLAKLLSVTAHSCDDGRKGGVCSSPTCKRAGEYLTPDDYGRPRMQPRQRLPDEEAPSKHFVVPGSEREGAAERKDPRTGKVVTFDVVRYDIFTRQPQCSDCRSKGEYKANAKRKRDEKRNA